MPKEQEKFKGIDVSLYPHHLESPSVDRLTGGLDWAKHLKALSKEQNFKEGCSTQFTILWWILLRQVYFINLLNNFQ